MRVNSLITHLQLQKMSIIYQSAHVAITFQLLEMISITCGNTQLNNFEYSHKVQVFQGKISEILPICIMKKNQIWKFRVNGIVSVFQTLVNVYQIS